MKDRIQRAKHFVEKNRTYIILGACTFAVVYSTVLYKGAVRERDKQASDLEEFRARPLYIRLNENLVDSI